MGTAIALFTRDLRVTDNPMLTEAHSLGDDVIPLFIVDERLAVPPNRARFLRDCLIDLRGSLRELGGDLVVIRGDTEATLRRIGERAPVDTVVMAEDYSSYARTRRRRVERACAAIGASLRITDGTAIVPPGAATPTTGGDHYRVFTPYSRAWAAARWRKLVDAPRAISMPSGITGDDPDNVVGPVRAESPDIPEGGETQGRHRWEAWAERGVDYDSVHDDLAADDTTRLSPYIHFGCVSALELATDPRAPDALIRQLCWRDFFCQVLAANPRLTSAPYRFPEKDTWSHDPDALAAWQSGSTGVDIVDAGMRQLRTEGWMHNRARLITASYLTKVLDVDWRHGAAWFDRWLVDADVANNYGNWQWVAGTGNDPRPNRRFNLDRQARRFDPDGRYVARYLDRADDRSG
ncbi:cryptochrome/photolyase family protein [Stackebrandtia soli]|uniref:cryptochrome/photolyase family protein n=1 Tax=Stackebrandtia soli TaxID=1892856 RepID=UPI0039EB3418